MSAQKKTISLFAVDVVVVVVAAVVVVVVVAPVTTARAKNSSIGGKIL